MNCPICKSADLYFIHKFTDGPAMQNKLHRTLISALSEEKVVMDLYGCRRCKFVFNANFDIKKAHYSLNYDNTQDNSKYFHLYLLELAKRLNKKYKLANKRVIEVGCGKGGFLKILHDLGVRNIKGFDPSYVNYDPNIDKLVVKKIFNKKNIKGKVDFIICRHVLEHIPNPSEFVFSLAKCLAKNGVMYFETPDFEWITNKKAFFDFFYEHCNYFSRKPLTYLFGRFGFKNILFRHGLRGQYFQLEVRRNNIVKISKFRDVVDFDEVDGFINREIKKYQKLVVELSKFIIWGAGAKGVTFLNRLKISRHRCKYVIDINPNKQNKFIPITGQKITSPKILEREKTKNIIIMNPVYQKEIKAVSKKYHYKGKFILI